MKTLILIIAYTLLANYCFSQHIVSKSENNEPPWLSGSHSIDSSRYFKYYVGLGSSAIMDSARKNAIQDVIFNYSKQFETEYIVGSETEIVIHNDQSGDSVKTTTGMFYKGIIKGLEKKFSIPCFSIIEYYWERVPENNKTVYNYSILVRIPRKIQYCDMPIYQKWNKSSFWRSAILPGWGQMHNSYKTKGTIILTTSAILLSGLATSQIMYVNNWNNYTNSLKLGKTDDAQVYKSNSDDWFLIRNINLVALGSVYIYNLVDALTKRGIMDYTYNNSKIDLYPSFCFNRPMLTLKVKI